MWKTKISYYNSCQHRISRQKITHQKCLSKHQIWC